MIRLTSRCTDGMYFKDWMEKYGLELRITRTYSGDGKLIANSFSIPRLGRTADNQPYAVEEDLFSAICIYISFLSQHTDLYRYVTVPRGIFTKKVKVTLEKLSEHLRDTDIEYIRSFIKC